MTRFERALEVVNRNSFDDPYLVRYGGNYSYIYIKCDNTINKTILSDEFSKAWKKHCEDYMDSVYDAYPESEYDYESTPGDSTCSVNLLEDGIDVSFHFHEFCVYGPDIPYFDNFIYFSGAFFNKFFSSDKYSNCQYESVMMFEQDCGSEVIGEIRLFTNEDNNDFEYSFSRLLPGMLEAMSEEYLDSVYNAETAESFLSDIQECDWVQKEWYEKLLVEEEDEERRAVIIEFISRKYKE